MDIHSRFPLGWIFPGYPSMIQLDGFWTMDEFGTLTTNLSNFMHFTTCTTSDDTVVLTKDLNGKVRALECKKKETRCFNEDELLS
jgi:hypothetical protein